MTAHKFVVFLSIGLILSYFVNIVLAGCESVCYDSGWCSMVCEGGSYPTNDGCHQGTPECGNGSVVSGGYVDGEGRGYDGAIGPVADIPKDVQIVGGTGFNGLFDCATGPSCSGQQMREALDRLKNGTGGFSIKSPKDLFGILNNDPPLTQAQRDGILNGSIIVIGAPSQSVFGTTYNFLPAWALIPPTVQQALAAQGGDGYSAPPGVTYERCRICENGNNKGEDVMTGSCKGTELNYCADYRINPEADPIVEYRFPICHAYAAMGTPILKIATRAHPVSSSYQFSLADDANPNEKCTLEMVGPDGIPNPTTSSDADLQVIRCDITKKPIGVSQDIIISSSSLPADGYGSPAWADRNSVDLSTCVNLRTTTDLTTGKSMPSNSVTIETYGQQLLAIALPFTSPWIKVADGTYARSGNGSTPLVNYLPGFVEPFNSSDKDTSSSLPHFLSQGGAGISLGSVHIGSVATISTSNWKVDPYTSTPTNTPSSLFKEIIQKKTYQEYTTSNPAPSALTLSQEITIIDAPTTYTLSSLAFNGGKSSYTLIIKNGSSLGNLTIDTASLNPTGSPALLLIADQITLSNPAATTIGAIIIANTLKTGTGDALYIKGNLSLTTPLTHQRVRADSDDRKPTIFIEFSPDMYLSLLPSLGSTSREWSQIE